MFLFLTANLNLADLDLGFFFISSLDAVIILFLYFSNKSRLLLFRFGKYLFWFDLLEE